MRPDRPADERFESGWYVEVGPSPRLAPWVASFWEMKIADLGAPTRVRILPNACVDIVLYLSETSQGEATASVVAPPRRSYVVGSTLKSFIVRSAGWRHVIGASLLPGGVKPLLGVPAAAIGTAILELGAVLGREADRIEDRVASAPADHLGQLAAALTELARAREPEAGLADRAVDQLRNAGGVARIDRLADDLSVSTRRLERHFQSSVGLSPKLFARLVRFDRAVRDLADRGEVPWARFALQHGYADQAHFINEFREFARITPAEFEAESRGTMALEEPES